MTTTVKSRGGVPVRLTDERWAHIVEEHCELAGLRPEVLQSVAEADRVLAGQGGELLALADGGHGQGFGGSIQGAG